MIRILSLGWGRQSLYLALTKKYDYIIFSDTGYEKQDTYRYIENNRHLMGSEYVQLDRVANPDQDLKDLPLHVYSSSKRLNGGILKRQCTYNWKILPQRRFIRAQLKKRGIKCYAGEVRGGSASVKLDLGITYDEYHRMRKSDVGYIENNYPLVDEKITRKDVDEKLLAMGVEIPVKSGCYMCPYKSKAEWRSMIAERGQDFENALIADNKVRGLVPMGKCYLHRDRVAVQDLADNFQYDFMGELFDGQECAAGVCFL